MSFKRGDRVVFSNPDYEAEWSDTFDKYVGKPGYIAHIYRGANEFKVVFDIDNNDLLLFGHEMAPEFAMPEELFTL